MSTMQRVGLWMICWALLAVPMAVAQSTEDARPGGLASPHVSLVGGQVFIDREGQSEPAEAGVALLDGDRLRTPDGHLDAVLSDGLLLHIYSFTTVDLVSASLVRLVQGGVVVTVRDPDRAYPFQMDASIASIQSGGTGEFGVTSTEGDRGTEVVVAVFQGSALVANDLGAEEVSAGDTTVVREGLAPSRPESNSARWDESDQWRARRGDDADSTASADALPPEPGIDPGAFDQDEKSRDDQNDSAVVYLSVVSAAPGFGRGPGRPGAGAHGDRARRPPGVMAFTNRRNGTIERVDPRDITRSRESWDAAGRPASYATPSRSSSPSGGGSLSQAPSRGHSYPRSNGDAVDNSPRSPYGHGNGGDAGSSPRSTCGRSNGGSIDDSPGSASPRGYGLPAPAPVPQYAAPRSTGGAAVASPHVGSRDTGSSPQQPPAGGGAAPPGLGRGIPSGGLSLGGGRSDSSSQPTAPRYNSGSGGSHPSAGGLSSAGPRGGRGRTPD